MGLFDKKDDSKPDFSNVQSGASSKRDLSRQPISDRGENTYTVKSGDTLSAIAKREYGDASEWRRIYEANRDQINNPDLIHPGQELKIPSREGGMR